jgi:hypothetical protein
LSADEDDEDVSDDDQKNTNLLSEHSRESSQDKSKLKLTLLSQSQEAPPDQQSRAKLVRQSFVDDDRGFPHSYSEQSKSRSFASSDFCSVSLKSSSLQVDDIRH